MVCTQKRTAGEQPDRRQRGSTTTFNQSPHQPPNSTSRTRRRLSIRLLPFPQCLPLVRPTSPPSGQLNNLCALKCGECVANVFHSSSRRFLRDGCCPAPAAAASAFVPRPPVLLRAAAAAAAVAIAGGGGSRFHLRPHQPRHHTTAHKK